MSLASGREGKGGVLTYIHVDSGNEILLHVDPALGAASSAYHSRQIV